VEGAEHVNVVYHVIEQTHPSHFSGKRRNIYVRGCELVQL
jgi:hypothetical protein